MTLGHYHLHLHAISKRKGHSIHAAVAYRHGTREVTASAAAAYRHAQESGKGLDAYDYRHKIGVQWFGIIAPDHAPAWCRDPQKLWAKVDEVEHRANARLAQEIIIALPHQVGLEDHIALLRAFVTSQCLPLSMIADIAIHAPPTHHGGDARNFHAHVLLTDRPITADGFTKTKDRRYSDKGLVDQFRAAWTATHNQHMERLNLPYRIDHRTLVQQRQEALARGDEAQEILLDRMPQIHLGKAAHGDHPNRPVYQDRLKHNQQILSYNTHHLETRQRHTHARHHDASYQAFKEQTCIAHAKATWQPEPASYAELQAHYGRPSPTTVLGRLHAAARDAKAQKQALSISRAHGHPWHGEHSAPNAPSILDVMLPKVKTDSPGHPVFTVTATDLVFMFYRLGFSTERDLQRSLEHIAQEKQRVFTDRIAKKPKLRPPPPLPKEKPPSYARPLHTLTQKLDARLGHIQAAVALHHARETAFDQRYLRRTWQREQRQRDQETQEHTRLNGRYRVAPLLPPPPSG